jgi:predicted nucleic acid-binding protein
MQHGRRKAALALWLEEVTEEYAPRLISPDALVCKRWGLIDAEFRRRREVLPAIDGLLAATAIVYGLTVVTRNVADFERTGAMILNPWET